MGVAAHTLAWVPSSGFSCQDKSCSFRKAVHQITCFFFTVVSRSRTLKDGLCPLGMGFPRIQYSMYCRRRVPEGFNFFSAFSTIVILHTSYMLSFFCVSRISGNAKKITSIDIMGFFESFIRAKFQMPSLLFIHLNLSKKISRQWFTIKSLWNFHSLSSPERLSFASFLCTSPEMEVVDFRMADL